MNISNIENVRNYIYFDAEREFSVQKIKHGLIGLIYIFLLGSIVGTAYSAYVITGLFALLFVSYVSWFFIWTKKYYKDIFAQRLFLQGSISCCLVVFFGISSCIFWDVSGKTGFPYKLLLLFGNIFVFFVFYLIKIFRIKRGDFSRKNLKSVKLEKYYLPIAVAGFFGSRLFLSEVNQNVAIEIAVFLSAFLSMLCLPGTEGLFKYTLIKLFKI